MPFRTGDGFLPDPSQGTALDLFYEKIGRPVREFIHELRNAPDGETRKAILAELNVARQLRGGDYIGRVEVIVDLSGTIQLDLEKPVAESDWKNWLEVLSAIHGVEKPERRSPHTVVLALGGFYRNKARATGVATNAVDLLHLTTAGSQIKFIGEG